MIKFLALIALCFNLSSAFAGDWECTDASGEYVARLSITHRDQATVSILKQNVELISTEGRFVKNVTDFTRGGLMIVSYDFGLRADDGDCFIRKVFTQSHPNFGSDRLESLLNGTGLILESRCSGRTVVTQKKLNCEQF